MPFGGPVMDMNLPKTPYSLLTSNGNCSTVIVVNKLHWERISILSQVYPSESHIRRVYDRNLEAVCSVGSWCVVSIKLTPRDCTSFGVWLISSGRCVLDLAADPIWYRIWDQGENRGNERDYNCAVPQNEIVKAEVIACCLVDESCIRAIAYASTFD